jgi:hypothetical protein|tara:strand:- start:23316 stop:24068 length:753 start_codon:yes stop_codon:yes gene_type:complete
MADFEKFQSANQIIDRVLVEVGLGSNSAPYDSADPAVQQLTYMLNSAGQELLRLHKWQQFQKTHSFTTDKVTYPTGVYPLPTDFDEMIQQTQWDQTNRLPLYGSLTPQDWEYLEGRQLANFTIYASFRKREGKMYMYPSPPPDGHVIQYEYISRGWVESIADAGTYQDHVEKGGDIIQYDPPLVMAFVKLKFFEARGFDTTKAEGAFNRAFEGACSSDVPAPILNVSGDFRRYPYLDAARNVPSTGYGDP